MAAPRWASFERSCDQYGRKLRADHGGSTPGGVLERAARPEHSTQSGALYLSVFVSRDERETLISSRSRVSGADENNQGRAPRSHDSAVWHRTDRGGTLLRRCNFE